MKRTVVIVLIVFFIVLVGYSQYLERGPGPTTIGEEMAELFNEIQIEQIEINHYKDNVIHVGYLRNANDIGTLLEKVHALDVQETRQVVNQKALDSYLVYVKVDGGGSFSIDFNDPRVTLPSGVYTLLEDNEATAYIESLGSIEWY
ncbi:MULTISPECIES: hypothetical protein [Shouchella]|uniref:Uncharacterized protein n=2 Tax=Shouchella TaxID=2893057 RepID=A0ABY7W2V6_9BACI|nr:MULTISPECIES: hypothetical protein [Shouchella]MED4129646.1 hypothetical protein [Shouchella miscanthi]WDF02232.1 hypothetical protein PQ477_11920 [Shouchella hunanensis]